MNKLVILWLFVFLSISVAPPPPPPCDGSPIGGICSEEADCCGPPGNQGCEGDKCCGRDKVRCPQGHGDCCGGFHCDGSGECKEGSAPPPPPGPPPPGPPPPGPPPLVSLLVGNAVKKQIVVVQQAIKAANSM
eukprot:620113_1